MAGDAELIEAMRRNTAQVGRLVVAMQGLTEALRIQGEGSLALAAAIAKVAEAEPQVDTTSVDDDQPSKPEGYRYLDKRGDGPA